MFGLKLFQAVTSAGKYGVIFLVVLGLVPLYWAVSPREVQLDPVRAEAADAFSERVAARICETHGETLAGQYVAVARLEGDQGHHIRRRIEAELAARSNCRLVTPSLLAKLREDMAEKAERLGAVDAVTADQWKAEPVTTLGEALTVAEEAGLDYIVYGRVGTFRKRASQGEIEAAIRVASVAEGADIHADTLTHNLEEPAAYAQTASARSTGWPWLRVFVWFAIVAALPWATQPLWRALLANESNAADAAALVALIGIDALVTFSLMGFSVATPWGWVLLGQAIALATVWNLCVLDYLAEPAYGESIA